MEEKLWDRRIEWRREFRRNTPGPDTKSLMRRSYAHLVWILVDEVVWGMESLRVRACGSSVTGRGDARTPDPLDTDNEGANRSLSFLTLRKKLLHCVSRK